MIVAMKKKPRGRHVDEGMSLCLEGPRNEVEARRGRGRDDDRGRDHNFVAE